MYIIIHIIKLLDARQNDLSKIIATTFCKLLYVVNIEKIQKQNKR